MGALALSLSPSSCGRSAAGPLRSGTRAGAAKGAPRHPKVPPAFFAPFWSSRADEAADVASPSLRRHSAELQSGKHSGVRCMDSCSARVGTGQRSHPSFACLLIVPTSTQ
ncbi:unnamed protein product [Prorocentrum cordatum]|uniref:Secreted protein n=1 Tax=Prorocentrum cordatum TaxID=2364126 RepID=A0ABN9QNB4_9DINO|nr:unnamed protein product [Polarella glacialis]